MKIGVLVPGVAEGMPQLAGLRDGLRELGHAVGDDGAIEVRGADGRLPDLPRVAGELVATRPDLMVVATTPAVMAARDAAPRLPIVMVGVSDPVGFKLVESLQRPGGNVTGVTALGRDTSGKRLRVLKEAVPRLRRVAVIWTRNRAGSESLGRALQNAARQLHVTLDSVEVRSPSALEHAVTRLLQDRPDGILVLPGPVTYLGRVRLVERAARAHTPVLWGFTEAVEAGGALGCGLAFTEEYRRAAGFVDRIVRGAPPGDLPVEQPRRLELSVNLEGARRAGMLLPPLLAKRADHVLGRAADPEALEAPPESAPDAPAPGLG